MSDKKETLKCYAEYSMKLAGLLKDGEKFSAEERTSIQNYLVIVQLALATSKYSGGKTLRK